VPILSQYAPNHGKRGKDHRPRRTNRIAVWNVIKHAYKPGQTGNPSGRPHKNWTKAITRLYMAARTPEERHAIGERIWNDRAALRAEARRFVRRGPNKRWR